MDDFTKDYNERINPQLATKLLAEAVPVIKTIGFRFIEVSRGYCKSLLPLNRESSNQHGTHQALLLGMAGDYTGGLAFASIIHGEPVLGLNEITSEKGMSLWLIKSDMQYLKTSVDDVYAGAYIAEDKHKQLNERYHNGGTILIDVNITFKNMRLEDVAKGTFRYYCKKKSKLKPSKKDKKPEIMFEHMLKTSAKFKAQLKYLESKKLQPLFIDEISHEVAGKQGEVIAERFMKIIPELKTLVATQTYDLDKKINYFSDKVTQVVFIGVGLDFLVCRQQDSFKGMAVYELELAELLKERNYYIEFLNLNFDHLESLNQIKCNMLLDSIPDYLLSNGFEPSEPTLFIYEGSSMYYGRKENMKILSEISELLSYNNQSILWMDAIASKIVNSEDKSESLKQFLSGVAKLGVPFDFGFDEEDKIFETLGLSILERSSPNDYLKANGNDFFSLFSFNLLRKNRKN